MPSHTEFLKLLIDKVDSVSPNHVLEQVNEFGDQFFRVNVRKINGNKVAYENINYVVVNPGAVDEVVYFLDSDVIAFENIHENRDLREKVFPITTVLQPAVDPVIILKG